MAKTLTNTEALEKRRDRRERRIVENSLWHLVSYRNGELTSQDFMLPRDDGRLACVGGLGENLSDFLTSKWPEEFEGETGDEGIVM